MEEDKFIFAEGKANCLSDKLSRLLIGNRSGRRASNKG